MSIQNPTDSSGPSPVSGAPAAPTPVAETADEAREQIDATREQLGETVEALAAKADVKGQAREKVAETKEQIAAKGQTVKQTVIEFTQKAQQATPEQATQAAGQAYERARQRPLPIVAIVAFLAGMIVGRRRC